MAAIGPMLSAVRPDTHTRNVLYIEVDLRPRFIHIASAENREIEIIDHWHRVVRWRRTD
jgi:hypothetical protein